MQHICNILFKKKKHIFSIYFYSEAHYSYVQINLCTLNNNLAINPKNRSMKNFRAQKYTECYLFTKEYRLVDAVVYK